MSKGIVYILTNPCLDGWVKIGRTDRDDINVRLAELNTPTNLPLSYRCYATYKVDNSYMVEKRIHSLIDRVDYSLHARETLNNGKIREREFFRISPETAYGIFKDVATLRGDNEFLKIYAPTQEESDEEQIAETKNKRENNSFKSLGINIGEEILFSLDENIIAKVKNNKNQVEYNNELYSVTSLAIKLLIETQGWSKHTRANGWRYFKKDGIILNDLREQFEISEDT